MKNALRTRGGFAASARPRRPYSMPKPLSGGRIGGGSWKKIKAAGAKMAQKEIRRAKSKAIKYLKRKGTDALMNSAENLRKKVEQELERKLSSAQKVGQSMTQNPLANFPGNSTLIPVTVSNTQTKSYLANLSDDRLVHKTHYSTGHPASRAVKDAIRENGGVYRVLSDSKIELQTVAERNSLTVSSGFNEKIYHVPCENAQVSNLSIKKLIGIYESDSSVAAYSDVRRTSNVAKIKRQLMIKNSSSNFPIKLTIHIIKIVNEAECFNGLRSAIKRATYTASEMEGVTAIRGKVPKWYQNDGWQETSLLENTVMNLTTSNKLTSLDSSSEWRSNTKVIESFSKTIAPGDFWNFSHTHNCGSGIDFDVVYRKSDGFGPGGIGTPPERIQNLDNLPFTYGIMLEAKGTPCEGYHVPQLGSLNTYIGTAPVNFLYEFKTSAYFASKAEQSVTSVAEPSIRTNISRASLVDWRIVNGNKEFRMPANFISQSFLDPQESASVGYMYIPTATSTGDSYKTVSGQIPG
jgi:hypothetical protein